MTSLVMERRIRLNWSPKRKRPWCPGLRRVSEPAPAVPSGRTGIFRMNALMDLLRTRPESAPLGPVAEPIAHPPLDHRDEPQDVRG